MAVISLLLLALAGFIGVPVWPDDFLNVIAGFFGLWLLGLGVGLILSVPRELVPEVGEIVHLVMPPLYLLSGVLFPLAAIPSPYRELLLLNPIAHGLEQTRLGFGSHYAAVDELAVAYPYGVALACILLGLILHRIYRTKLITQ